MALTETKDLSAEQITILIDYIRNLQVKLVVKFKPTISEVVLNLNKDLCALNQNFENVY